MSEEEVLAMVMEQSRCEYVESLKSTTSVGASRDQDDDFGCHADSNPPTVASYIRKNQDNNSEGQVNDSDKGDDNNS
ncbi:unnamed protein product [Rodentolepis nana]|uniref:Ovule protein n=1 Tax=Rodentolepis nana TaxID=102285 RepID=A0A0R3TB63_RODNA|nr:unnamed protein product [Rodentolepis nana]